ncbi:MAG: hypothetical protein ACM3P0_17685 [Acidobacteriota bacterium]
MSKISSNSNSNGIPAPLGVLHKDTALTAATRIKLSNFIKSLTLNGADNTKKYNVWQAKRNAGGEYTLEIALCADNSTVPDLTDLVAGFAIDAIDYVEPTGVTELTLSESNSSGISGKAVVDWSAIDAGTVYMGYAFNETGINNFAINMPGLDDISFLNTLKPTHDADGKVLPSGMTAQKKAIVSLTSPTPDYLGQMGIDAFGDEYIAISLTGTMWQAIRKDIVQHPASRTLASAGYIQEGYWTGELETWFDQCERVFKSFTFYSDNTNNIKIAIYSHLGGIWTKISEVTKTPAAGLNSYQLSDLVDPSLLNIGTRYNVVIGTSALPRCGVKWSSGSFDGFNIVMATGAYIADPTFYLNCWLDTYDSSLNPINNKLNIAMGKVGSFEMVQALQNLNEVVIPDGTWEIDSNIVIPSGKIIRGVRGKSILQAGSSVTKLIDLSNIYDVIIDGIKLKGTGADIDITSTAKINSNADILAKNGIGTKHGIYIDHSDRVKITNCEISNFDNSGIYSTFTGNSWINGILVSDNYIHDNYLGINSATRTEFSKFVNNSVNLNLIGQIIQGGNTSLANCTIAKNRCGLVLINGDNDSHGVAVNVMIPHNNYIAMLIDNITYGFSFANLQQFDDSIVQILNSKGVVINSSLLSGAYTITGCASAAILGCMFNTGSTITQSSNTYLGLKNNFFIDGSSAASLNN